MTINEAKTKTINEMAAWVRAHNLAWQVRELVEAGNVEGQKEYIDAAIEYVYDAHILSPDEFRVKYIK